MLLIKSLRFCENYCRYNLIIYHTIYTYLTCPQFWCVSAFSTAEEFRLEQLSAALSKTNMYEPTCLYSGSDDGAGELDLVLKQSLTA